MVNRPLTVAVERWPIAGAFTISRGAKTEAAVVVAEVAEGPHRGRGECVPYARYGESIESVVAAIEVLREAIENGLDRATLQARLPPGAARNAIDCALWDLEAKRAGKPAWVLAGLPAPQPMITAYTISLAAPSEMAAAAEKASSRALLKVKLGADDGADPARIAAVRQAAPNARLIVDANEGWSAQNLGPNIEACADEGVELIEQPLPANADDVLAGFKRPVSICADESLHGNAPLTALTGKYNAVNIKLDKPGGLTAALSMVEEAQHLGFGLMIGCMVATSLAMAPAMLIAQRARFVDLDGPLLLAQDRPNGLRYAQSLVFPPEPVFWG
ncbi:MAG: dipeptide epimerase [Pseudolabrys sp.]|nr:dipeptide epimerase [Pseudolabrys sp.]